MKTINVMLDEWAFAPSRAYGDDAGLDLHTPVAVELHEGEVRTIDTGVHVQIPRGYVGIVFPKSGIYRKGIKTMGVVDAGYTGSIGVTLANDSDMYQTFNVGNKIAQLVILPIETPDVVIVDEFPRTPRGNGGFGSTGA